jgi:lipoprotein signal peptidase
MTTFLVAIVVLVVDAATKALASPVITEDFTLGIPGAGQLLTIALAAIVLAFVVEKVRRPWWAAGLILGGGVANIGDRVLYGGVRDWIETPIIIFNLADVAVVAGVVAFLSTRRKGVQA